jgi:hypothetical protein
MVAEKILTEDERPPQFEQDGFESNVGRAVQSTKTNVYGVAQALNTPEKAQRFSSQSKNRKK